VATFRSLRVRNFRLFAAGQFISLVGTWGQRVAQDWLVLRLTDDSGLALGIATGLQFLPVMLFSLYGGVLADRYNKRRILIGLQAAMACFALLLAALDLSQLIELWHVYALAFALGTATAIETPVRATFLGEMVGSENLTNAVSLNSALFNCARLVGPAVAGLAIAAVGTGWVFLVNALSFSAVLASLKLMRPAELLPSQPVSRASGQLREGLLYVRSQKGLLVPILLMGVVGTLGLPGLQVSLALITKQVFERGPETYGVLSAMLALGSLLGALFAAGRSAPTGHRRLCLYMLAFGALEVTVGLADSIELAALLLVPAGFMALTLTTSANSTVQLGSSPQMRGRVMATYFLVFLGGNAFGAPIIGGCAQFFGPQAGLLLGGAVTGCTALVGLAWTASVGRRDASARRRPRPASAAKVRLHNDA
jgi:MFS family permease